MSLLRISRTSRFVALTLLVLGAGLFVVHGAQSESPELSSWIINKNATTGYNGLLANVQSVQFSDNFVYVRSTGIPTYAIGPWPGQPNVPSVQNYLFRLSRKPSENTGNKISTGLFAVGYLTNGVPIYNMMNARSYNNQNIWHENAVYFEAPGLDKCGGHPQQQNAYHHHLNPSCFFEDKASEHSPLLGFAIDGFPIYGPRGCANADGTGGVKLMKSSYRTRTITQRTTLPDGTQLNSSQYGPEVGNRTPLGAYMEDFEYAKGLGDLDQFNGRFAVTPEYPKGTYAYFATIDEKGAGVYPYLIGPQYYGTPLDPQARPGQTIAINETAQTYQGASGLASTNRSCK
jgi:hypothetical protein